MSGHVVVVLGAHRSGTSLVANAMPCRGASLGPRAYWTAPDNPTSFAEDLDVLHLDERVLWAFGHAWDDPRPLPEEFENHPALQYGFGRDAVALLRARLAAHPVFAIKEPRLCRLLPFWRKAFREVGCRVSVVFVVRHPMAVAASLAKRNGFTTEKGLAIWLAYVLAARAGVDPEWKSCTIEYNEMLTFPHSAIHEIGRALGLQPDMSKVQQFSTEFVDHSLRHEDASDEDNDGLPIEVRVVWEMERAKARRLGEEANATT